MNTQQQKSKWKTWHKITVAILILLFFIIGRFVSKQEKIGEQKYQQSLTQAQKDSIAKQEKVNKSFSAWDGSHNNLVKYVKDRMNDPNSFEHVSTKYWIIGETIVVLMVYRGKNAFGGVITENIKAETNIEGEIKKVFK